jgi:hypothetical protein
MRKQHALLACIFCICTLASAQTVPKASSITGKTICGYQGWFNCYGDGSPVARWFHWSNGQYQSDNGKPAPGQLKFEMYPDIQEYEAASLFQTGFATMGDGVSPAKLFSSYKEEVIQKHFSWMEYYGIDGIALQRFIGETFDGVFKLNRDTIAARVKRQAEKHGRIFYLMYDISGMDAAKFDSIKSDWQHNMAGSLQLTSSPYYVHQDNKPVVCIWGFGFTDRPGTAAQCLDVINWFKANGCFVIGGVPTNWRTSSGDSKPGFSTVYDAYDMISPWSVGRFSSNTGADNFRTNYLEPDLNYCNAKNILYQPVVFPGFAWANWNGGPQNEIPRNRGEFMWRQVYNIGQSGIGNMYVAMFDEYDEGTAIAKAADSYYAIPSNQYFLTTSADGTYLSPDYYLRLTGQATKVINGMAPLTPTASIPYSTGPILFRSGFELKYDAALMAADAPETSAGNTSVIGYGGTANPPECGVVSEINHIGNYALRYAGRDNSAISSRYYFRVFDVNIPVDITTHLSFWTYPQNNLARYVSVDLQMTDGTFLHNTAAVDTSGSSMHPATGRGVVNSWTKIKSNIGQWLQGKTIQRILIGYDHDAETGDFRGYIDDIVIEAAPVPVLPVKLAGFSGALSGNAATLWWQTESEINASHIIVERSYDGRYFETATTLPAQGSAFSVNRYNYTDKLLASTAQKVFYRLKFADTDGKITYSHVLALSAVVKTGVFTVYPNPVREYLQLQLPAATPTLATITLSTVEGQMVLVKKENLQAGSNTISVTGLSRFAPGVYQVSVKSGNQLHTASILLAK